MISAQQGLIDGLAQERRKSIANALELRLSCINVFYVFLGSVPADMEGASTSVAGTRNEPTECQRLA